MDWLATIDVPMMTLSQAEDKEKEGAVLADVLMSLKRNKIKVLFRKDLCGYIDWGCKSLIGAIAMLSTDDYVSYLSVPKSAFIKADPDVLAAIVDSKEKEECRHQLYYFHTETDQINTLYVISSGSSASNVLNTILDKKIQEHNLLHITASSDIDRYMSSHRPFLMQLKHHGTQYVLGGNPVSAFSAYDKNDESYAKRLLAQAFDDYQGVIASGSQPDALFTRDMENSTYVCFNHSGNWAYHGYDIPATDVRLPDYIKRKYNIWK